MKIFLAGFLIAGCLISVLLLQAASFEAAVIKPAVPDPAGSSGEDGRNGTLKVYNVTLKRCIRYAYRIAEDQIVGGPKWIDNLSWDILAKADQPVGEPELLSMLQPLLAERFQLKFHRELRTLPGYALTVDKDGVKATVSDPASHSGGNGGRGFIDSHASQFSALTIRLSALLGRPVIDASNDTRKFDFHLQWTPDDVAGTSDHPSLFTALREQLGLKLESRKVQVEVFVIDEAALPSEN